jgi:hypothetical protein
MRYLLDTNIVSDLQGRVTLSLQPFDSFLSLRVKVGQISKVHASVCAFKGTPYLISHSFSLDTRYRVVAMT